MRTKSSYFVHILLSCLSFPLLSLAQLSFSDQKIICQTDAIRATDVFSADLDGDGDQDVVFASLGDNKIAWYENIDGSGTFGTQNIISKSAIYAQSVFVADLDGDGDMDVISASRGDHKIVWYENTDGQGAFGTQKEISYSVNEVYTIYVTDMDGDGDQDVLSASRSDNKIIWYENIDSSGTFGPERVITTSVAGPVSVYATDLDEDGDVDVLSASGLDNKIAWYSNMDGQGLHWSERPIYSGVLGASSVYAVDLDGDGDMDVLSASRTDNKVTWYENTDGHGTFHEQKVISTATQSASCVYAEDLDGDGDLDVISASELDGKIAWYENVNGKGSFGLQNVITTSTMAAHTVYASDLDGDGDIDVLSASEADDKIAWYENTDSQGEFGPQIVINTTIKSIESIYGSDLDADGDIDVLSASRVDDKIAWYENMDGQGTFGPQSVITISADGAESVYASDLDGDGDMDVLSASEGDDKIAWYENTDGRGSFSSQRVITTLADEAMFVYAADMDGDGDQDVLSASEFDNKIAWYENVGDIFGPQQVITTSADGARSVYAVDLDGDSDSDVLSASRIDDKIAWYENIDGQGMFGTQSVITLSADGAQLVYASDLDGDGDMDVLSASEGDDKIAWYENFGDKTFGPQQIITTSADEVYSVYAADLDGDEDMDVLSASFNDDKIAWYENTDSQGNFGSQNVITTLADGARSVFATDLDRDGDIDVLSASETDNKISWYENLIPHVEIPVFDPISESYISSAEIIINCPTSEAVIHYTTNEADPAQSDSIYSEPIIIDTCTVFKAKAFKAGMFPSPIIECMYTIVVDTPAFSPSPLDTFYMAQEIEIHCKTPEVMLYYTTNGEAPTQSDSLYISPLHIDTTTTIKVRAYKTGCEPSTVAEAVYLIDLSNSVSEQKTDNTIHDFRLLQNFPNPFNLSTIIHYQLSKESVVFLKLFDLLGRQVVILENGSTKEMGRHSVLWDGRDANGAIIPSGIYILRIQAADYIEQIKLVVIK